MGYPQANPAPLWYLRVAKWAMLVLLASVFVEPVAFAKALGTVKSTSGNSLVLTVEGGTETTVTISDSTRILRTAPGQLDLKTATPIQLSDVKVGDRVLALGPATDNVTAATTVVVMKQSDIASKQQQEREEWRRGVGGIVKAVDTAAGTITLANALSPGGKTALVHVSSATEIRRYSPDSVKFDDAKPSTLAEIKPGDQLRARGEKNADATEFTAQAIVSGAFREIAGTVVSTNAANNSITVMDLGSKKPVTLKITADSQMHKLPPFMAQRLAMRFKGGAGATGAAEPTNSSAGSSGDGSNAASPSTNRAPGQDGQGNLRGQGGTAGAGAGGGNWHGQGGGPPDFQQVLARLPGVSLTDLQKGDAVMLVATEGSANSPPTTITLLSGVEPILTAAPSAAAATILSPWNLGGSPGGGEAAE